KNESTFHEDLDCRSGRNFWQRSTHSLTSRLSLLMKRFLLLVLLAIVPMLNAAQNTDADFGAVAEEFIKGYLNARPLLATRLGFHEYDGQIGRASCRV